MKVLVIGGGGREHAIAWRLSQSDSVSEVFIAPGNPGSARVGTCIPVPYSTSDAFLQIAKDVSPDLTVIGPEAPLVEGVVDQFAANGLLSFGPTAAAARLEGSKIFAKDLMLCAGIPTARFAATGDLAEAESALSDFPYPIVIKADGLAAGKGVVVCEDEHQAKATLAAMFAGDLVGSAGARVVIEEFLVGEEVSFIGLCDGANVVPLEPSQDHKTIFEDDKGPNTGGMGAYSDSRILTEADRRTVLERVMLPVVDRMKANGTPFCGFLYAGLMMTAQGPMVLEFNVRLGDPESQALLHRMDCDFGAVLFEVAHGRLNTSMLRFKPDPSVCVVLAAHGYPGKVRTGDGIHGLSDAEENGAVVFHAGTRQAEHGIVTSGGRVLGVTHSGATLQTAIENTYSACARIHFDGMQIRRDIGKKGLRRW